MGGEEAEQHEQQSPLLLGFPSAMEPSESIKRTGTIWSAMAHIITGVIGAGVLSLAWSVAQLGWIAGPLLMIVFALVTIVSNNILSDCYRYPDPNSPTRNRSYLEAVKLYLGEKPQTVSAVFVHESLYGTGIAYTITAAGSVNGKLFIINQEPYGVVWLISLLLFLYLAFYLWHGVLHILDRLEARFQCFV